MTNDKPNLTNTAFADMMAEPFAELLKPKKFYPTIMLSIHQPRQSGKRLRVLSGWVRSKVDRTTG